MQRSLVRIYAMLLRYFYILRGSWPRVVELVYWPTIQMILWGFIAQYYSLSNASFATQAAGAILGAVMLWDMLFRTQLGVSLSFMEEMWSRNLGHLFVSPLRPFEWCISMITISAFRAIAGMIPAVILAIPFYGYSLFDLGLPLIFFFFNLMFMGWWLGLLITAMLLRAGLGAEGIAWATVFLLAPVSAVFYPVSALPEWLQAISWALPAAHVFEGLRDLVLNGVFEMRHMLFATALNIFYLTVSCFVLFWSFNHSRKVGTLLQAGD